MKLSDSTHLLPGLKADKNKLAVNHLTELPDLAQDDVVVAPTDDLLALPSTDTQAPEATAPELFAQAAPASLSTAPTAAEAASSSHSDVSHTDASQPLLEAASTGPGFDLSFGLGGLVLLGAAAGGGGGSGGGETLPDTVAPVVATVTHGAVAKGADVSVTSNEAGTVYLVKDAVSVHTLSDITHAADALWNSATATASPVTTLPSTGLSGGVYHAYAADAAGNLSAQSSDNVRIYDPTVVVFDLVHGVSSDHSNRTFDANTQYTIYIQVDRSSATLDTVAPTGSAATWGTWSGAQNLGWDDKVVLVRSTTPQSDPNAATSVLAMNGIASHIQWSGPVSNAASLTLQGLFSRTVGQPALKAHADLWNGSWAVNPNFADATGHLSANAAVFLNAMPAGVLTSQGLA
jgi:hypothetical protein